jgi:acyl-CoA thioesterase
VRALERSAAAEGRTPARLSFDLWRPVSRQRITASVTMLHDGRTARTVESSPAQDGKPVARCTDVFLKADAALHGLPAGRPRPPHDQLTAEEIARLRDAFRSELDLAKPAPAC